MPSIRMPVPRHRLVAFAPLVLAAAALAFFSPRLGIYLLLGVIGGATVAAAGSAASAAMRERRASQSAPEELIRPAVGPAPQARRRRWRPAIVLLALAALAGLGILSSLLTFGAAGPKGAHTTPGATTSTTPVPLSEVGVRYSGTADYDKRAGTWIITNRLELDPPMVAAAASSLSRHKGLPPSQPESIVERFLRRHGWGRPSFRDGTAAYVLRSTQKTPVHWWPLRRNVSLHLGTTVPEGTNPLLFALPTSTLFVTAPNRMIQAAYPTARGRTDMLNGDERVTIRLDTGDDEPPSAVTLRVRSSVGRNFLVLRITDFVSKKWFGWLIGLASIGGGLMQKRIRAFLARHLKVAGTPDSGRATA